VILLVAVAGATLHALAQRYLCPIIVHHIIRIILTTFCCHRSWLGGTCPMKISVRTVNEDLRQVTFENLSGLWVILLAAVAAAALHALARTYLFPVIMRHARKYRRRKAPESAPPNPTDTENISNQQAYALGRSSAPTKTSQGLHTGPVVLYGVPRPSCTAQHVVDNRLSQSGVCQKNALHAPVVDWS
jgi:hypothetical protein